MLSAKQSKRFIVSLIIFFSILNGNSFAQNEPKEITFIFPALFNTEFYGNIIAKKLKSFYHAKGYSIDRLAEKGIIIIPLEVEDKIALTFIWTRTLPKNILDFNVKNEVFYIDHPRKDTLSSEGKFVREYITREFLSDYRKIQDYSLALTAILNKDTFERELEEFISKNF